MQLFNASTYIAQICIGNLHIAVLGFEVRVYANLRTNVSCKSIFFQIRIASLKQKSPVLRVIISTKGLLTLRLKTLLILIDMH